MKIQNLLLIFLSELILFLLLWLWNDFFALMMTYITAGICLSVLVISLIAEFLERSNVSKLYYWIMFISTITPFVAYLLYFLLTNRNLDDIFKIF